MKFVSKISMAALILVGLAIFSTSCSKDDKIVSTAKKQSVAESPLTKQYPGLKYTQFSTSDLPLVHLKNYSLTFGSISHVGFVCYVNNGTTTTTWRTAPVGSFKTKPEAAACIPAGWRIPSRADFEDLYAACYYANVYLQDQINFWYTDGLAVPPDYTNPIYVGYGYFWLSDTPRPNTDLLAVNQPDGTTGLTECQVAAKAWVWAVK